jgi:hypothetical protein
MSANPLIVLLWDPKASAYVPLDAEIVRAWMLGSKRVVDEVKTGTIASGSDRTGDIEVYSSTTNLLVVKAVEATVSPSRRISHIEVDVDGSTSVVRAQGDLVANYGNTIYGSRVVVRVVLTEAYTPKEGEPSEATVTVRVRGYEVPRIQHPQV